MASSSRQSQSIVDCNFCQKETKYKCITCNSPVCNRCSLFQDDEETIGWEAGVSVGYCPNCEGNSTTDKHPVESPEMENHSNPYNSNTFYAESRETSTPSPLIGRKRLDLNNYC